MTPTARASHIEFEVVDNPDESRYEARTPDGEVVGACDYRRSATPEGSRIVYPHTFVLPELEGQGIAATLAHHALDEARDQGAQVVPACWFMEGYIERHPEYQDLVER
ncbi:GNAT family N-acetyltransferase [Luteimicrobium subarcticum]|uniref:Uncharacterized protein n=1 Tax=Luteimicrobium subarcticum TaxID=620910 RepID=A0A2M8W792_9MICO|nr:GNAT family N-acetyltransferase [Luteimicrobium subarcticum]PJI86764.1 hypothetical protein CLV34_2687 [Luteimicrobium subarcticum]